MLFNNAERLKRYIYCLCIGLPIWFVVGVLVTQAPEIGQALNAQSALSAGKGVMFTYLGISLGDFLAGWLAQIFKSRRKVVLIYQIMILLFSCIYLTRQGITENEFLWLAFLMGLGVGYWATFITIAAEQFGTNIRSTVTTTAPKFCKRSLDTFNIIIWSLCELVRYNSSSYDHDCHAFPYRHLCSVET
ncbi:Major Facilitator Superfamily [Sphingobacterium daejeonense]|nr:Major Facilitator Superfamily [Sphingobacterium daejeonense]